MNKIALALVGGVCSGKTTFATIMEKRYNFFVISKDRCIYESDIRHRYDDCVSWEIVRKQKIDQLNGQNIVIDETIRIGKLKEIKEKGYTIIAVKLDNDRNIREKRLRKRHILQKKGLLELSLITKIDLVACEQEVRRSYWRSKSFYESIEETQKEKFDTILEKLYLLGSNYLKDEEPNPVCYNEIDYILEIKNISCFDFVNIAYIKNNCIPFSEYKKKWSKNIKYCIWDVGGVFYNFSLDNFNNWCISNTLDTESCSQIIGTFNFNEYMLGNICFDDLCKQICDFYYIPYCKDVNIHIENHLRSGVGEMFPITAKIINSLKDKGITNCVLSNALPILVDIGNYPELITPENRFYSFDLKRLKPENSAYIEVCRKLNINFSDIIFVDDKPRNTNAAIELGIYSIEFNVENIEKKINEVFD